MEELKRVDKYTHLENRLYAENGMEIWYQNREYLVVDRMMRYSKFYASEAEARKDEKYLERRSK